MNQIVLAHELRHALQDQYQELHGQIGDDETACPAYTNTPADRVEDCIDPDIKPRPTRPPDSCPFSFRGHMAGAVGLVVNGNTLVTGQRFTHVLLGFTLDATGNFMPYGEDPAFPTPAADSAGRLYGG